MVGETLSWTGTVLGGEAKPELKGEERETGAGKDRFGGVEENKLALWCGVVMMMM